MRTIDEGLISQAPKSRIPGPIALAGLVTATAAALLALWAGRSVTDADLETGDLVAALPTGYWAAVLFGGLASILLLQAAVSENGRYAQALPPLWLTLLHVAPHLAGDRAGSAVPLEHVGLTRLLDGSGSADIATDGRLAWPGGLAVLMAIVADLGDTALELVIRLWPGMLLGATAVLVSALARRAFPSVPLIGPVAAVTLLVLSWTGQEQLSAHGLGFLAALTVLVVIESGPLRATTDWSTSISLLDRFAAAAGDRPLARSRVAFATLLTLGLASIVSSPIAPFFVCFALLLLGLHGRRAANRLLAILTVGALIWIVIAARPWWAASGGSGLFSGWSALLNDAPAAAVGADTASASGQGAGAARLAAGLFTFGSIVVAGAAMATDRFRHLRPAIPLAPLALLPAAVLAIGPVRSDRAAIIGFYVLPAAAVLVARALATIRMKLAVVVLPALLVAATPILLLARYGDDSGTTSTGALGRSPVPDASTGSIGPIGDVPTQLLGLLFLVTPFLALQWDLGGRSRRSDRASADGRGPKWRLEIYANDELVRGAIVDRADIPFPVKQVRSAKGELALRSSDNVWALPRIEFEVDVDDPFTDDVLSGLLGHDHQVRFVTGDEAVVDARNGQRIRLKALRFR